MKTIHIKPEINPSQLVIARQYRGYSQTELCKHIKGLSQPNLSKFEKGYWGCISEEKLSEIMIFLNFPYEFLYRKINIKLPSF